MRCAAIYARVSTADKQDFNRQVNDLTAIAQRQGYSEGEIKVFAESLSGYKKSNDRPKLQQILDMAADAPKGLTIYTTEISRIGRNPIETRRIVDHLTDLGVPVYIESLGQATMDGNGKRNMMMNIILQVLIEYANLEAETFKARSKSGLLNAARKGKAGGSLNLPYGYKKDSEGYLVVDEEEASVIKEIFRLYQEKNGIRVIAGILNGRNVPTRLNKTHSGKQVNFPTATKDGSQVRWSDKQIHDILRNPLYKGKRRFKGELLTSPSIVDDEIWDACDAIMHGKTHRNYLTTYTYLLKDICACGTCGRNYFAKYKPVEGGDKVYICSSRLTKGGNCGNVGVNITLIESAIYDLMLSTKSIWEHVSNKVDAKQRLTADIERLSTDMSGLQKQLISKQGEKDRLLNLYIKGAIAESIFVSKQNELESHLSNLINRLSVMSRSTMEKKDALKSLSNVKATRTMMLKARKDREQLRAMILQIIEGVTIYPYTNNIILLSLRLRTAGEHFGFGYLALDLNGTRKKPPQYRYMDLYATEGKTDFGPKSMEINFDENKWKMISSEHLVELK
ncbi:MAG: hypothetical protein EOO06_09405 [Chitinophagaceae bacterium]|nr:MAG: hypothetical protein EOO06_09405 [Chitinophagaceae bacterium]